MQLAEIAEEADDEIQYMKESLKHEIQADLVGQSDEQRQANYRQQSREAVSDLKSRLEQKFEKDSQRKKSRVDTQLEKLRDDQKDIHEREI